MKLRIKKTFSRNNKRVRKSTRRKQRIYEGGNNFIVDYDGIRVSGQQLSMAQTTAAPSVTFRGEPEKLYTLIMWDPDVPPKFQPGWAHWIAINLKSRNDILSNQLLPYMEPSPPSGTHRYFFGLFEQTTHINPQQPERPKFNVNIFIKENSLKKLMEIYMKVSAT